MGPRWQRNSTSMRELVHPRGSVPIIQYTGNVFNEFHTESHGMLFHILSPHLDWVIWTESIPVTDIRPFIGECWDHLALWGYCTWTLSRVWTEAVLLPSETGLQSLRLHAATGDADKVKLWIIVNHLTSSSCCIFLRVLGFKSSSQAFSLCFSPADMEFYDTLPHPSME